MKKIKILSILTALMLVLGCMLCSCTSNDDGTNNDNSADVTDNDNSGDTENDGDLNISIGGGSDEDVVLPDVISDIDTSYLYTDIEGRFTVTIPYVFSVYNEGKKTLDEFYMESPEGDASVTIRVMDVMSIWDAMGDLKDKYPDGQFFEEVDQPENYAFFKEEVINGTTTYAKVLVNEDSSQAYIVEMSYPDTMYEYFEDLIYEIDLKIAVPFEEQVTDYPD